MKKLILVLLLLAAGSITSAAQMATFQTCGGFAVAPSELQSAIEGWRSLGCDDVHLRYDKSVNKWLGHAVKIAPSSVAKTITVTNAGIAAANGTYTERGVSNGKPYYNLAGYPNNAGIRSILWGNGQWLISDAFGNNLYSSDENVATPDLATMWNVDDGTPPAPTVQ